ncbi:MAG: N-succinylarginine dihydrolase [Sphingomonadales bacterium]|nr:N-succinylarginine dihydrolase [Sphingomonadales bacterium]
MSPTEINFDGIVGPSHNYAGLSAGNLASAKNAGAVSHPLAAALQGIEKMRANIALGLTQGFFLPHDRPDGAWLAYLGTNETGADPHILAASMSASAMWAANAATVSPAPDTKDGRCHLTPANLLTMAHRAHEWPGTLAQLKLAFANPAFAIHDPVPAPFGDEGAANHMRLSRHHGAPGVEVFVYGLPGGRFPARQHVEASRAVARLHGLSTVLFVAQSEAAIAAGAFHNDVVAVANERVLFTHEHAFADKARFYDDLKAALPEVEIVEVPADIVSLADAITSYLFNAQLVTLPGGGMALILPSETRDNARVWGWLETLVAGNGPIRRLVPVDVRESMANGGGPACLRLRVVADPADVDARFLANDAKLDLIAEVVRQHWPESIAPHDLGNPALIAQIHKARAALIEALKLPELSG